MTKRKTKHGTEKRWREGKGRKRQRVCEYVCVRDAERGGKGRGLEGMKREHVRDGGEDQR